MTTISKELNLRLIGGGKVGISIAQAFTRSGFKIQGIGVSQEVIDKGMRNVEKT